MDEMSVLLGERIDVATASLLEAVSLGDDYLIGVRLGELQELDRLASTHDIEAPGLRELIAQHETGQSN